MPVRPLLVGVIVALSCSIAALQAAQPATRGGGGRRGGATTTSRPATTQSFAQTERDPTSPRHSQLKSKKPDANEVVRIDVDHDGDPDILEHWWSGHRARWLDENDDMRPTDSRGDMTLDCVQIDRDDDGYYDGPEDISIKWCDDDGDGRPDLQLFGANPTADARSVRSGTAHWMVFIDTDHDGVNGYVDWRDFEFRNANWRVPPATSPVMQIPPPNFSPDYMGNAIFLKEHYPPGVITNPEYNWENPFAFYDYDNDGVTEMTIRLLETARKTGGTEENPVYTFYGYANEAMGGWDLDNDSEKGNEFDFDMSFRFFTEVDEKTNLPKATTAPTAAGKATPASRPVGGVIDYRKYRDDHPKMVAPKWVIDGKYFRFDNWRKIDHFVYVTHDKCFDEMWKPKTPWQHCWMVFDEDDDDHRWERVEFQYPSTQPYNVKRMSSGAKNDAGFAGHVQSDSLGDRGEWDDDNSGRGQIYIGRWDRKIHLYGAEKGAWTIDETAKYWGSRPVVGNSSPTSAPAVGELVQYADTDKNGFLDEITFDYDGDQKVDLKISLLDYKTDKDPHPDVRDLYDPGKIGWKGMHELFAKRANLSFQESLKIYRSAWKKGFTDTPIDNYAFASSVGDRYNQAYWLRERIFRLIDKRIASDKSKRDELRRLHFLGDVNGMCAFIESLDGAPIHATSQPASTPNPFDHSRDRQRGR